MMSQFWRDALGFVRQVRRSPGVFCALLVTLSLAIGVNTAIFAYVHTLLIKELPVHEAHRLVAVDYLLKDTGALSNGYSRSEYEAMLVSASPFEGLLARGTATPFLERADESPRVNVELVSDNYFTVLGIRTALGRPLNVQDERQGAEPFAVVVADHAWRTFFGSDRNVLDTQIRLNGRSFRVVGVSEPAFRGTSPGDTVDFLVPIAAASLLKIPPSAPTWLKVLGRLKEGLTIESARRPASILFQRAINPVRASTVQSFVLRDGRRGFGEFTVGMRLPTLVLMMASVIVLVIASVNIAGLLWASSQRRRSEFAIRASLGATRTRIASQLAVEGFTLGVLGAGGALLFAFWVSRWLAALLYDGRSARALDVGFEPLVLLATVALVAVVTFIFTMVPAWTSTRHRVAAAADGQTSTRRVGHQLMVAGQLALSIVLLFGAATLVSTLRSLRAVDLGFDVKRVAMLELEGRFSGQSRESTRTLYSRALEIAQQSPGVASSALSIVSVLSGDYIAAARVRSSGSIGAAADLHPVHIVTPGYFEALSTPIFAGRGFDLRDVVGSPPVAIVNERLAELYWPKGNALGEQIQAFGNRTVIGVVKSARYKSLREPAPPTVYLPLWQLPPGGTPGSRVILIAKAVGPIERVLPSLRQRVADAQPALLVGSVKTLEDQRNYALSAERSISFLSGLFAGLATVIALMGLAGLMAQTVLYRQREIGIRVALGASRVDVGGLFFKDIALVVGVGVVVGGPAAWAASRWLDSSALELNALSPLLLAAVVVLLSAACVAAAAIPLARALKRGVELILRAE